MHWGAALTPQKNGLIYLSGPYSQLKKEIFCNQGVIVELLSLPKVGLRLAQSVINLRLV